jgi:DNA-binding TFAR19-related protein (PDSD5 family)
MLENILDDDAKKKMDAFRIENAEEARKLEDILLLNKPDKVTGEVLDKLISHMDPEEALQLDQAV